MIRSLLKSWLEVWRHFLVGEADRTPRITTTEPLPLRTRDERLALMADEPPLVKESKSGRPLSPSRMRKPRPTLNQPD